MIRTCDLLLPKPFRGVVFAAFPAFFDFQPASVATYKACVGVRVGVLLCPVDFRHAPKNFHVLKTRISKKRPVENAAVLESPHLEIADRLAVAA